VRGASLIGVIGVIGRHPASAISETQRTPKPSHGSDDMTFVENLALTDTGRRTAHYSSDEITQQVCLAAIITRRS